MKHECEWYIQVMGANPQTGEQMDKWGCAMAFLPMLTIENSLQQRQTSASIQSFRNEVVAGNEKLLAVVDNQRQRLEKT